MATPKVLGRYEILRHLASGGMAEVLLARSSGIEGFVRHVVIKRIHPEQARDATFVEMFLDEARLAATLHHHNIVQVYDIGREGGEYFFAMEYVHGEDLSHLLQGVSRRKDKVPLDHVVTIVTCASAALHYAHDQRGPDGKPLGIVHRDISPQNILVGYDGNVKVVDFGIAKAAQRSSETRTGTLKGKVSYMSPEQCTGRVLDRRSDVFALGIVLYELTTAKRLFRGENDFNTMSAIVSGAIPPPSTHRPELPPALEAIIMKALARSPAERYQSADELRLALEEFAGAAGLRASTTALADYVKRQFGSRPEPWLPEAVNAPPAVATPVGEPSQSGVARAPTDALETFEGSSSMPAAAPIIRARNKEITKPPPQVARELDDGLKPTAGMTSSASQSTTGTGTPMAWVASTQAPPPVKERSRTGVILIAVAAVCVAGVAIFVGAGGSSSHSGKHAPAAQPPPQPQIAQPVVVAPVVAVDAGVAQAVAVQPPADAAVAVESKPPAKVGKPPTPPTPPTPPKKKWSSDELFPE